MLKDETKKIIEELARKYRLKAVMLFGSAAKGRTRPGSDVDLAILADQDFYEKNFSDFTYDLMAAEEAEKREFDVVPISGKNPILLYNIFNDGAPIYIRDREEYWRLRSWARFTYEEARRFFYGREKLLEERLSGKFVAR